MRRVATAVLMGTLAVGLGACGGGSSGKDAAKKILEKNGVKVKNDGNTFSVSGNDGKSSIDVGAGTKLPSDFPSAVPVPSSKVVSAVTTSNAKGAKVYSVTFQVGGDSATAANDYKSSLRDKGFTIDEGIDLGGNNGGFAAYTARSSDWDVSVVAASGSQNKGGLVVTVQPHDSSTDSTSTTSSTSG